MLIKIPIQKVPHNINLNKMDRKLVRLSCATNNKDDLLFHIISSNTYLQYAYYIV